MSDLTALRLQLLSSGYFPVPVNGKSPVQAAWSTQTATPDSVALWETTLPNARSTGLLTRTMPTLDIDLKVPEAVESLVAERFEERGYILPRIGQAPKRAFPFRTDNPFKKITAVFESGERIE